MGQGGWRWRPPSPAQRHQSARRLTGGGRPRADFRFFFAIPTRPRSALLLAHVISDESAKSDTLFLGPRSQRNDYNLRAIPTSTASRKASLKKVALLAGEARSKGKRTAHGVEFTFGISNQELASHIGTVRELVSRNLSRLQAAGLIKLEGRTVIVPDLGALEGEVKSEE